MSIRSVRHLHLLGDMCYYCNYTKCEFLIQYVLSQIFVMLFRTMKSSLTHSLSHSLTHSLPSKQFYLLDNLKLENILFGTGTLKITRLFFKFTSVLFSNMTLVKTTVYLMYLSTQCRDVGFMVGDRLKSWPNINPLVRGPTLVGGI